MDTPKCYACDRFDLSTGYCVVFDARTDKMHRDGVDFSNCKRYAERK